MRFAREGANVAINYRSGAEQAQATMEMARSARTSVAGKAIVVQADVYQEEQVKATFAKALEAFGLVDAVSAMIARIANNRKP